MKGTFRIFLFSSSIRIERRDSVSFVVIGGRKFGVGMEIIFPLHGCNCRRENSNLISWNYSQWKVEFGTNFLVENGIFWNESLEQDGYISNIFFSLLPFSAFSVCSSIRIESSKETTRFFDYDHRIEVNLEWKLFFIHMESRTNQNKTTDIFRISSSLLFSRPSIRVERSVDKSGSILFMVISEWNFAPHGCNWRKGRECNSA